MAATQDEPRFIVVEGPVGAGKADLATRLAKSFDAELILEKPLENPFLVRSYQNHRQAALPTRLFLLFQRARLLDEIRQSDLFSPVRIADFLLEKDRLFAELYLDASEYALYEQVYRTLDLNPPTPSLVVYLQAPPDVLMSRIASRSRELESGVDMSYLERLGETYARFFHQYDATPLLIVNAAEIDPIQRESDYQELLGAIERTRHGRHFYNPAARAIV